ncbi:MAG: hypothetical protein UW98_C0041G0008 [Parcubacteria group bacterium GW2011_GWC2_45_15]|nr:MAG: hypothetical protein UW98_C0041G0008 [Parcubacteria group bacterium GW2011_GWC2_45_15]
MNALFNGIIFGRQTERIKTHGMQNIEPLKPKITRHNISGRVAFWMADVQTIGRGIGKHVQNIFFFALGRTRLINSRIGPDPLPFLFNRLMIKKGCHDWVKAKRVDQ